MIAVPRRTEMFHATGTPLEKEDYFLLAETMKAEEMHPEIIAVLDAITNLAGAAPAQV
jgi:hypothetical protein